MADTVAALVIGAFAALATSATIALSDTAPATQPRLIKLAELIQVRKADVVVSQSTGVADQVNSPAQTEQNVRELYDAFISNGSRLRACALQSTAPGMHVAKLAVLLDGVNNINERLLEHDERIKYYSMVHNISEDAITCNNKLPTHLNGPKAPQEHTDRWKTLHTLTTAMPNSIPLFGKGILGTFTLQRVHDKNSEFLFSDDVFTGSEKKFNLRMWETMNGVTNDDKNESDVCEAVYNLLGEKEKTTVKESLLRQKSSWALLQTNILDTNGNESSMASSGATTVQGNPDALKTIPEGDWHSRHSQVRDTSNPKSLFGRTLNNLKTWRATWQREASDYAEHLTTPSTSPAPA